MGTRGDKTPENTGRATQSVPPPQVLLCTGLEGTIHKACSALGPGCLEEEGVLEQEAAIQCTGFSPSLQGDIALLPLSHGDIHSGVVLPRVEQ